MLQGTATSAGAELVGALGPGCRRVRAALDQIDGLTSSVGELGVVAVRASPVRSWCGETAFCPFRSAAGVRSRCRARSSHRWNRCTRAILPSTSSTIGPFCAWVRTSTSRSVSRACRSSCSFVVPRTGLLVFRGYGWANEWLSYLAGLTLEKFGTLVEVFGLSTPFLQRSQDGFCRR